MNINPHPRIGLLKATGVAVFLSWLNLLLLIASIGCGVLECSLYADKVFLGSAVSLVIMVCVSVILAVQVYCPNCGKKILRQNLSPKHPMADIVRPLDYWSTAIIRILNGKPITCMYCGTKYSTEGAKN